MVNKINTEYLKYFWPLRHYLVSCGDSGRANIITVSFCMPVSRTPPMVVCAVGQQMYSHEIIQQTNEFVINVPAQNLKQQCYYCGFHSGRDCDKFQATGLTPACARHVSAPIVVECVGHIECRVAQAVATGDKTLFIATVLDAYADEDVELGHRKVEYAFGKFPAKVYGTRGGCSTDESTLPDDFTTRLKKGDHP